MLDMMEDSAETLPVLGAADFLRGLNTIVSNLEKLGPINSADVLEALGDEYTMLADKRSRGDYETRLDAGLRAQLMYTRSVHVMAVADQIKVHEENPGETQAEVDLKDLADREVQSAEIEICRLETLIDDQVSESD